MCPLPFQDRIKCRALGDSEFRAAQNGQVEKGVELLAGERFGLGGALDLDEAAVAGADDVHVGVGTDVLLVAEVEERYAADDADGDGADRSGEGWQ